MRVRHARAHPRAALARAAKVCSELALNRVCQVEPCPDAARSRDSPLVAHSTTSSTSDSRWTSPLDASITAARTFRWADSRLDVTSALPPEGRSLAWTAGTWLPRYWKSSEQRPGSKKRPATPVPDATGERFALTFRSLSRLNKRCGDALGAGRFLRSVLALTPRAAPGSRARTAARAGARTAPRPRAAPRASLARPPGPCGAPRCDPRRGSCSNDAR
jgi:hypothetical protein